ncbi:hypothetical protein ACI65C_001274 [Semiaphis heraclei]
MINCSYFQRSNDSECLINVWKDNNLYTDDYIKLVNSHWLQFMPPNFNTYCVWGISYASIMIFGYIGNFKSIFMILKCKPVQTSANILVLNLCASNFIVLSKSIVVTYNSYYLGPMLGNIGCQIDGFVGTLGRTVSTMTLTAISLDRYNGLVHPLKSAVRNSKNRAKIWIAIIWIYGFLLSVVPLLDMNDGYAPEGILISCNFDYLSENKRNSWYYQLYCWCENELRSQKLHLEIGNYHDLTDMLKTNSSAECSQYTGVVKVEVAIVILFFRFFRAIYAHIH